MNSVNRIVQTLWTKPVFQHDNSIGIQRFQGGWLNRKYNYMSWTLSCLQFRKFYDNVELVTDMKGKQLLIDLLDLPYSNVRIELDCLNHYPNSLWTIPKIYSYMIQEQPFIHADGDVIIWERLGGVMESAKLCAQQLVINHKPQYITLGEIETNFSFIPECIVKDRAENRIVRISNAGLLGGTHLEFFKDYATQSFEFVDKNLSQIDQVKTGNIGMIFEEYLFYCLAKEKGIEIIYYLDPIEDDFKGTELVDFYNVGSKTKLIHPIGTYKKYQQICDLLSSTLLMNYPKHYYRILELLRDCEI